MTITFIKRGKAKRLKSRAENDAQRSCIRSLTATVDELQRAIHTMTLHAGEL